MTRLGIAKWLTFLVSLTPAVYIGWQAWLAAHGQANSLGPDPGKAIEHFNGDWTLRFLLITLAVTPLRQLTGLTQIIRLRRMLGLFTFFYATLHFASYLVFILRLQFGELGSAIVRHPYILVGFAAWCLLVPL
ncbi:MAG TPA: ferric reductase-like transmembrane domain-containing protein, partial [Pseudomonadales bacterium]|nr:ferric reductase-like transmembrane domain-containing protein [Pseudomonadales bacterium]